MLLTSILRIRFDMSNVTWDVTLFDEERINKTFKFVPYFLYVLISKQTFFVTGLTSWKTINYGH